MWPFTLVHDTLGRDGVGVESHQAKYAGIALVVCSALNLLACLVTRFHGERSNVAGKLFETFAGLTVATTCLLTLLIRGTYFPRQVLSTALMCAWGVRLSVHLHRRDVVHGRPPDLGARVLWAVLISLPCVLCNTRQEDVFRNTVTEVVGLVLAVASFLGEAQADCEKQAWFRQHKAGRPGRSSMQPPVAATGWWHLSRNPNLFFELTFHWGIYLIVRPVVSSVVVVCPVFNTLTLAVLPGGMWTRETERNQRFELYPAYLSYRNSTSPCLPMPQWAFRGLRSLGVPDPYHPDWYGPDVTAALSRADALA